MSGHSLLPKELTRALPPYGGIAHQEYWIPAEELDAFNAAIVGHIEVARTFS